MLTPNLSGGPAAEKQQLLVLGIGLAVYVEITALGGESRDGRRGLRSLRGVRCLPCHRP